MASDTQLRLEDLYKAYERRLAVVENRHIEIVRLTLQLLCYSIRSVTLRELAEAVVVRRHHTALNPNLRIKDPGELLDICRGLITETDGIVDLGHPSLKDYLESEKIIEGPASAFFIEKSQAHFDICLTCLTYLSYGDFESGSCQTKDEIEDKMALYPFLQYAAEYWYAHVESEEVEKQIEDLIEGIWWPQPNPKYLSWVQIYRYLRDPAADLTTDHDSKYMTIHFPAQWGLSNIVRQLLGLDFLVNNQSNNGCQPLIAAIMSGSAETVKLLLEAGADPNIGDEPSEFPLEIAITFRLASIVQLLIHYGADVSREASTFSPLTKAVRTSTEEIVRILLEAGADINARNESRFSPLLTAVWNDSVNMVQILLHFGADTRLQEGDPCSPLEVHMIKPQPNSLRILQMLNNPWDRSCP